MTTDGKVQAFQAGNDRGICCAVPYKQDVQLCRVWHAEVTQGGVLRDCKNAPAVAPFLKRLDLLVSRSNLKALQAWRNCRTSNASTHSDGKNAQKVQEQYVRPKLILQPADYQMKA